MMNVTAVGRSDVGRTRHGKANEDSFHVGDSAFAVADGMGGHLAGEVASALALEPLSALDGRVYADSTAALTALRDAVAKANERVVAKAHDDASFRGMGTTLTAVMVEGRRAHIAHVGDSRAYLLRDGVFSQLTTDHTLVQRLIDEGRLTSEEAAHHPQRSVITRAIGVEDSVTVDAMTLDLQAHDRILLCSDGLSGPVTDEAIAKVLSQDDLDRIPDDLIDAANDAGGPDNVTAVVISFDSLETAPSRGSGGAPAAAPVADGEHTDPAMVVVRTSSSGSDPDWAGRLGHIGKLNSNVGGTSASPGRSWTMVVALIAIAAVIGGGLVLGRTLLQRSWFVGVNETGTVTIYQGVPVELGPVTLSWAHRETLWEIEDVPEVVRDDVRDGIPAADAADAQLIVDNFATLRDSEDTTETEPNSIPSPGDSPVAPSSSPTSAAPPPVVSSGAPVRSDATG